MQVVGIDKRVLSSEQDGASFLVLVYEGDEDERGSWSVGSYLLTEADLPRASQWLREHLPAGSCWALGVVLHPSTPTPESDLTVAWVVGSDVLNLPRGRRSPREQRLAEEMQARRHHVPTF